MLRVLALLPYPVDTVPGQRFRIEQWIPHLERMGIVTTCSPFLSPGGMAVVHKPGHTLDKVLTTARGYVRRLWEMRGWYRFDVAVVFREAALFGPPFLERALALQLPFIYDFDDAIYLKPVHPENRWVARLKAAGKTGVICRLARHVTVGNETLASFARPLAAAVSTLPTTIDTDTYRLCERRENSRPVIGWTGSSTTLPYLTAMSETLVALRRSVDFELRVIGGELRLPGIDVTCLPWRAATEVKDLCPIDIGLMPLPDDMWTRGKCGLKAIQYMALGIPAVVSPVGANAEIVTHGENGFHASTPAEWLDVLRILMRDAELRRRVGLAGRRTVEQRYSAQVQAPRFAAILKSVASSRSKQDG